MLCSSRIELKLGLAATGISLGESTPRLLSSSSPITAACRLDRCWSAIPANATHTSAMQGRRSLSNSISKRKEAKARIASPSPPVQVSTFVVNRLGGPFHHFFDESTSDGIAFLPWARVPVLPVYSTIAIAGSLRRQLLASFLMVGRSQDHFRSATGAVAISSS